jgi:hypothetical protein
MSNITTVSDMLDEDRARGLINDLAALGEADAHELADVVTELVIAVLAHDPAIPPRTCSDWWVQFAPTRARIVELLHQRINGHIDADDVLRALEFEGAW